MKKLFRRFCTLMIGTLFCTAIFGSLGMSNGAQIVGVKELEAVSLESSSEIVMPTSICTPTKPELTKKYNSVATQYTYYESYHCFAAFPITNVGNHPMEIHMGTNNGSYDQWVIPTIESGAVARFIAVPKSQNICNPTFYLVSAYCPTCRTRSSINATMINEYDLAYNAKSRYVPTAMKLTGTIPTSFDENGTIWSHGGSTGDQIRFSIAYNGVVADRNIAVPFIGTRTSEVVLNGVTFSVRTGPNKVSIKASVDIECDMYSSVFGFYLDPV